MNAVTDVGVENLQIPETKHLEDDQGKEKEPSKDKHDDEKEEEDSDEEEEGGRLEIDDGRLEGEDARQKEELTGRGL